MPFESVPKSRHFVCDVLLNLDSNRFLKVVRVEKHIFYLLLDLIKNDDIFNGKNSCHQFPVIIQLLITLYRLGCYGEGSSITKVAMLFGISDGGTIDSITKRVFNAILKLKNEYIYWPAENERDQIVADTYEELP